MSRRDYAVKLFGGGSPQRSYYSVNSQMMGSPSQQQGTTIRYGTVVSDSYDVDGQRYVEVILDGSTESITVPCDANFKAGDRIVAEYNGNRIYINVVSDNIVSESVSKAVEEVGSKISEEVAAEVQPVKDSFEAFKQDHQLTDEQITKSINDVVSTADAALEASSSAVQTVDSFQTTVNQKFEDYDQGVIDLGTRITQTESAIQTEVSDRTEAVSGALQEAKSYTDQQADSISQTVESNVMNSVGQTYATKSELSQTSTEITATFNGAISDAKDEIKDDYSAMIRLSAEGVEVGTSDGAKTTLGSNRIGLGDGSPTATIDLLGGNASISNYLVNQLPRNLEIICDSGVRISTIKSGYSGSSLAYALVVDDSGVRAVNSQGDRYELGASILFNNESGTSYGGSIRLSARPSYFHTVEVVFFDSKGRVSTVRTHNNGGDVYVSASMLVYSSSSGNIFAEMFSLAIPSNSTTATWGIPGSGYIGSMEDVTYMKIRRIIGYGG